MKGETSISRIRARLFLRPIAPAVVVERLSDVVDILSVVINPVVAVCDDVIVAALPAGIKQMWGNQNYIM